MFGLFGSCWPRQRTDSVGAAESVVPQPPERPALPVKNGTPQGARSPFIVIRDQFQALGLWTARRWREFRAALSCGFPRTAQPEPPASGSNDAVTTPPAAPTNTVVATPPVAPTNAVVSTSPAAPANAVVNVAACAALELDALRRRVEQGEPGLVLATEVDIGGKGADWLYAFVDLATAYLERTGIRLAVVNVPSWCLDNDHECTHNCAHALAQLAKVVSGIERKLEIDYDVLDAEGRLQDAMLRKSVLCGADVHCTVKWEPHWTLRTGVDGEDEWFRTMIQIEHLLNALADAAAGWCDLKGVVVKAEVEFNGFGDTTHRTAFVMKKLSNYALRAVADRKSPAILDMRGWVLRGSLDLQETGGLSRQHRYDVLVNLSTCLKSGMDGRQLKLTGSIVPDEDVLTWELMRQLGEAGVSLSGVRMVDTTLESLRRSILTKLSIRTQVSADESMRKFER